MTKLEEIKEVAQDIMVDLTIDTGKSEEERQKDMEAATARIIQLCEEK